MHSPSFHLCHLHVNILSSEGLALNPQTNLHPALSYSLHPVVITQTIFRNTCAKLNFISFEHTRAGPWGPHCKSRAPADTRKNPGGSPLCRIWNTCKCSIRHLIQSGSLNSEAILFPLSWWLGIELEGCQPWKAFCHTKSIHIYFLLVHAECSAIQLCLALWDPMDYSPTGSSVNEISQARILEWVAVSSCRGYWPRDQSYVSCVSCIGRQILPLSHL